MNREFKRIKVICSHSNVIYEEDFTSVIILLYCHPYLGSSKFSSLPKDVSHNNHREPPSDIKYNSLNIALLYQSGKPLNLRKIQLKFP